jgi:hypothetical protein
MTAEITFHLIATVSIAGVFSNPVTYAFTVCLISTNSRYAKAGMTTSH